MKEHYARMTDQLNDYIRQILEYDDGDVVTLCLSKNELSAVLYALAYVGTGEIAKGLSIALPEGFDGKKD